MPDPESCKCNTCDCGMCKHCDTGKRAELEYEIQILKGQTSLLTDTAEVFRGALMAISHGGSDVSSTDLKEWADSALQLVEQMESIELDLDILSVED